MIPLFVAAALAGTPDADDSFLQSADSPAALRFRADLGAVAQLSHQLQIDEGGSLVNVPRELGQDILYPFLRFQVDLDLGKKRRNTLAFLYQPLDFQSEVAVDRPLRVGDVRFARGQGIKFRYGFPFYRLTWLYDVAAATDREVAFGVGLQIRNANIVYSALDGSAVVASRNIGPVPLLAFRSRVPLDRDLWFGAELQGFYAPISGLNGSTNEVVGALADGAVKLGLEGPMGTDLFAALRYIGGGAVGTSSNPDAFNGDGFTRNWIHFAALTFGVGLR